jgi:hypothetical protein
LLLIFGAMSLFVLMPKERRMVVSRQVVTERKVVPTPQARPQLKQAPLLHSPAVTSTGFINFGSSWTADPMPVEIGPLTRDERAVAPGGDWLGMLQSESVDESLADVSIPDLTPPRALLAEIESAKKEIAKAEAGTTPGDSNANEKVEPANATVINQSPQTEVQRADNIIAQPAKVDAAPLPAQSISRPCGNSVATTFICVPTGSQLVPAPKEHLEALSANHIARRCAVR